MLSKNQAKFLRQLKQKKHRDLEGLYILEGNKMVIEALSHHHELVQQVICTPEIKSTLPDNLGIEILQTDYETLSKISSLKTPQRIIATAKKSLLKEIPPLNNDEITLALDDIKDPGNLGTIIRLADWFGINKIICSPETVDCYNPKVVQASMGAILRVNMLYKPLTAFLKEARNMGATIYGAMLEGENIYQNQIKQPAVLVMGNESVGIREENQKHIDVAINIPNFSTNPSKTESLNVSISTSVILSEFRRQQAYSK